jgi:hypothetical protein
MSRLMIEVSSTHPGDAWRMHLASQLAMLHPGADIRVAYGLVDDAYVWDDQFGFCERLSVESEERTSIVEAFINDGRDSFAAAVLAAEDLAERVENECASILRAWTRVGRPFAKTREWMKKLWVRSSR